MGRKAKGASSPAAGDEEKVSALIELRDNIRSLRLAALQKLESEEEKRNFLAELQVQWQKEDGGSVFEEAAGVSRKFTLYYCCIVVVLKN